MSKAIGRTMDPLADQKLELAQADVSEFYQAALQWANGFDNG